MGGGQLPSSPTRTRAPVKRTERDLGSARWLLRESPGPATGRLSDAELSELDSDGDWLSVSTVPADVHLELLRHGRIEDPYLRRNEAECQCLRTRR